MLSVGNGSHFCTVLMSMSNITFKVPRLSTFVFIKSSEKIITIILVGKELTGFWLDQCWHSIANGGPKLFHNWANVSCPSGSGLSGDKASPVWLAVCYNGLCERSELLH